VDVAHPATSETARATAYPEGWFQVAYSDDVAAGQVVPLRYFGRELVVFRTESGVVQVFDAYCAHLGAHLGVGGAVVGDCLRCPFHGWEYGIDGVCHSIPYSARIPKGASVGVWPTTERTGLVLMWHSPIGNPPLWEPPELAEYGNPAWSGYTQKRYVVRTSAQEIVENIVDVAHGQIVHGNAQGTAPPTVEFTFNGHTFTARFQIDIPTVGGATEHTATVHGLGLVVNRSVGHGSKCFWSTYTPIDRDAVEVNFSMLTARSTPDDPSGETSRHSARGTLLAFEQDIPIWEHKIHRAVPLLCDGDGPIGRFRVWTRQFHPQCEPESDLRGDAGRHRERRGG
jgi:3-ketosteroid 9alpha-monooxygenase subunit A